jgi:alanine racemase
MNYSLNQIQDIYGGELTGPSNRESIESIYFDTRKIGIASGAAFICFKGQKRDGHDFISEAYRKGIRQFIVEDVSKIPIIEKGQQEESYPTVLTVDSTISCLQQLATHHRAKFDIPIIGITGSNGKTIVKEWLSTILSESFTVVKSPMSYNSQIGVALSLLQLNKSHDLAIIEAAVAEQGDMKSLAKMIKPTHGIFTNIGDAHQSGFRNRTHKIAEKCQLFGESNSIVYCADHSEILTELKDKKGQHIHWTTGNEPSAHHTINLNFSSAGTTAVIDKRSVYTTPFTEAHSIENLMHCIVMSLHLQQSPEQIQLGINKLSKQSQRLQLLSGNHQSTIIDDSYSFDLISLQTALNSMKNHAGSRQKVLIISDIPNPSADAYSKLAALCQLFTIDKLYHAGKDQEQIKKILTNSNLTVESFISTDDLKKHLRSNPIQQAVILVKGARAFEFETIVSFLTRQTHDSILEVNLGALRQNLNVLSKQLAPTTKILSIIKANAYGTGSTIIGNFLESVGVDYLGVAYADEGIELRNSGVQLPILVLNPESHLFDKLTEYDLEPEIYSLTQVQELVLLGDRAKQLSLHLKVDTGMNRLGFQESELDELIDIIKESNLKITGIMSHLAASDDKEKDAFTKLQIERFERMSKKLMTHLKINPIRHFLNSSGVIRLPEQQYEMVRIGKGMYGIDMTYKLDDELDRVHRLFASIAQIKDVPAGSTIGYGCHNILDSDRRIAIINIGYADGLIRSLGNGVIYFLVNGQRVPTIGNVCMDMCMLDITDAKQINVGDRVEIFGTQVDIRKVAGAVGTIPLEILSKLSSRLKKVYVEV